jgi:hypothetical protein
MTRQLDGGSPRRSHQRKGSPTPATTSLLERWQAALRAELGAILAELEPVPAPAGLLDGAGLPPAPPKRPDLATRARLIALGVQVAHELGTELDQSERAWEGLPEPRRPRGRVDYGGN